MSQLLRFPTAVERDTQVEKVVGAIDQVGMEQVLPDRGNGFLQLGFGRRYKGATPRAQRCRIRLRQSAPIQFANGRQGKLSQRNNIRRNSIVGQLIL
jgi:hypothetical protein